MSNRLNIVADAHIWGVESAFADLPGFDVRLQLLESSEINRQALKSADILLTRSATKVNESLLAGTPVRFAATATIGDDHYDTAWLDANRIVWANAAGSSTGSVIEYMLALLIDLHLRGQISIPDTTIGIIGVGRIGSALAEICRQLGMQVLLNDPPRARAEGEEGFSSLEGLLNRADLITLHTPLIRDGEDRTFHLLGSERLAAFRGTGIINTGRGSCADNSALIDWLNGDASRFAALDCWEHEPSPLRALFNHPQLLIATPHIAGHSLDGKAANTLFAYHALCRFLNIEPQWRMALPPPPRATTVTTTMNPWANLHAAVSSLYPLCEDSDSMKSWADLTDPELSHAFTGYRRHYPVRRAWQHCPIHFTTADIETRRLADAIGLKLV
ncbi:4-phosphoerythronate dehydrogenase [Mariprofundus ferrooxydans]|uniref:4-phosphoerythronate dehydrogenase n=1 Tax=Mariprofundus ferrooxydans TaxID=314344 RepID=UPI0014302E6F|nr:4-phosphoerythronate dehydrogenase [Mariprofundus ferrooxydans]